MNYLYHARVPNFKGNKLIPLNQLKEVSPQAYNEAVKKYKGRESLMRLNIPFLNCLWNDVIHLTAVHPEKLKKAFRKAGGELINRIWFKIDPRILSPENTIVYLYPDLPPFERNKSRYYVPFDINNLGEYNSLSSGVLDYYRTQLSNGRRPLMFHLVPHILYKGILNIKDLEVIKI